MGSTRMMKRIFLPEGTLIHTRENREATATPAALEAAMVRGAVLEGTVTLCDSSLCLHVELGCAHGIIRPEEAVLCRPGERRKDIAVISRVGKPVAVLVTGLRMQDGELIAVLSRAEAQRRALEALLTSTRPGDLLPARVTHLEPFGAFLDVGCGVASLLSVDCISISRIAHPRDRLTPGMELTVAVKSIERDTGRIYVTLRELLGTWEENAAAFEAGQTVRGIVRSVEDYGIFVELAPNLAGLAELRPADADAIRRSIGHTAAVYIKSIVPERMKIKLVLIDVAAENAPVQPLRYFLSAQSTPHLSHWVYSPPASRRVVETLFDA